jgi:nucleotide-binding universal stress UspA family protein
MKKILLAYDGGEPARRALETAGELARAFHAPVSVVSVMPQGTDRPAGEPRDEAILHARELQEATRVLAEQGIEVELLEPSGDPGGRIEQIVDEGGFDTIVLGSGKGGPIATALASRLSRPFAARVQATIVVAH